MHVSKSWLFFCLSGFLWILDCEMHNVPFLLAHIYWEWYVYSGACKITPEHFGGHVELICISSLRLGENYLFFKKRHFPVKKHAIFDSLHSILERRKTYSLSHFTVLYINFMYLAEEVVLRMPSIWSTSASLILNMQLIWIISTKIFKSLTTLEKFAAV